MRRRTKIAILLGTIVMWTSITTAIVFAQSQHSFSARCPTTFDNGKKVVQTCTFILDGKIMPTVFSYTVNATNGRLITFNLSWNGTNPFQGL